jgi:hypothetical protein
MMPRQPTTLDELRRNFIAAAFVIGVITVGAFLVEALCR